VIWRRKRIYFPRSSSLKEDIRNTIGHIVAALLVQVLISQVLHDLWSGAIAATLLFVGREHAQAEYRWIEVCGHGRRKEMPWWGGFDLRLWDRHAIMGVLGPAIATFTVALA
jgi:hypothetical protein